MMKMKWNEMEEVSQYPGIRGWECCDVMAGGRGKGRGKGAGKCEVRGEVSSSEVR